jgi:NAD(P)-dependent dehydrogenase (short-subunit alcohol dehydrogenase family)
MDLGLRGRAAIVTGASQGIGRAIAVALAAEGARVMVAARRAEALEQVVAEIASAGGEAAAKATDITDAKAIQALVEETAARFGGVHVLVNNAGGQRRRAGFDDLTDEDFLDAYTDNVLSVVRAVRACLPHMRAQRWGRIINVTSEAAEQPERTFQHYNAAKAAQLNLTKSLSKALARDGVLVNAVSPGLIATPGVEAGFELGARQQGRPVEEVRADFFRKFKPGLVLGRAGQAAEVAAVVAFLASEQAAYVTGSNYRVDGGSVVGI